MGILDDDKLVHYDETANTARKERPVLVNCDEEAWFIKCLERLVDTTAAINRATSHSWAVKEQATKGAIHGAAVDALRAVGLDTQYINIKKL